MADSRELADKAFSLLQDALSESEARAAELDAELKKKRAPKNELEAHTESLEHELESVAAERDNWQQQAAQLEEVLENERARIEQLKKRLDVAESGPDKADKKEINFWRARSEKFDEETRKYKKRIAELRKELNSRDDSGTEDMERLEAQLMERETALEKALSDVAERDEKIAAFEAQDQSSVIAERDQRIADLVEGQRTAESDMQAAREQIAGLEEELSEEKECGAKHRELANERLEQITKLTESVEEAQERYEEAKWQLERASRFERLVTRRRKLIDSLIAGLRAKQKSNTALKAGLDGLRRFKARAEAEQQKLLVRIDELSTSLREAEQKSGDDDNEELRLAEERITELEARLNTQVEVIESLESDLNTARASSRTAESYDGEIAELKETIEARNQTIQQLESDIDAQQEQLAKLRGSESESMRLKAVQEQDSTLIGVLREEIASLKSELEQQQTLLTTNSEEAAAASATAIRKRESQMGDLKRTIRDQEKEIARLNEAVAGWQKKYEFLSTDAPAAYQSSSAEQG